MDGNEANFEKVLIAEGIDGGQSNVFFYHKQKELEFTNDTCQFSLEIEQQFPNDANLLKRVILSTTSIEDGQFLRTGVGNLELIPVIDAGNIVGYPTAAYFSKDQKCRILQQSKDGIVIESEMQTPIKQGDIANNLKAIRFITNITFGQTDQQGLAVNVINA